MFSKRELDYIHSPGGPDDVPPMDEETMACIIAAECHAYSFRNHVALGCWSVRKQGPVYSGRDEFGRITLLINYKNETPLELPIEYDLWEDIFLSAWRDGGKDNTMLQPRRDEAA